MVKKTYVLDANALLTNPWVIWFLSGNEIPDKDAQAAFEREMALRHKKLNQDPNNILLPDIVFRELDHMKSPRHPREEYRAYLARQALVNLERIFSAGVRIRALKQEASPVTTKTRSISARRRKHFEAADLVMYGNLQRYVIMPNNAHVLFMQHNEDDFQSCGIPHATNDDRIVYQAVRYQQSHSKTPVILISSDRGVRIKARLRGLESEDLEIENIIHPNQLPSGIMYIDSLQEDPVAAVISDHHPILLTDDECQSSHYVGMRRPHANQVFSYPTDDGKTRYYINTSVDDDKTVELKPVTIEAEVRKTIAAHNAEAKQARTGSYNPFKGMNGTEIKEALRNLVKRFGSKRKQPRIENRISALNTHATEDVIALYQDIVRKFDIPDSNNPYSPFKGVGINLKLNTQVMPRNEQIPYLDMLLNPDIKLITVNGPAGTGKTYFALLAGVLQLINGGYAGLQYIKPVISAGPDLGFLPGDQQQKIKPWVESALGNLYEMFCKGGGNYDYDATVENVVNDLWSRGVFQFDTLAQARGRTWHRKFTIVDEAQLLTKRLAHLMITRTGLGSKTILLGDFDQMESEGDLGYSFVTSKNSGLAHVIERYPGRDFYGHITLSQECVFRSVVAKSAHLLL